MRECWQLILVGVISNVANRTNPEHLHDGIRLLQTLSTVILSILSILSARVSGGNEHIGVYSVGLAIYQEGSSLLRHRLYEREYTMDRRNTYLY